MAVETAAFISQLNSASPAVGDLKSEGDDHLRVIKTALQGSLPNLGANAVTVTAAELNAVAGRTVDIPAIANIAVAGTGATALYVATQPTTAVGRAIANLDVVDSKILAAAVAATLPSQTGNGGKYIKTNGTTASWEVAPNFGTLLATLTPTVSTAVDFLSTFSSAYDNYLILGSGVTFGTDDGLSVRLAASGAADTGSNYITTSFDDSAVTTTATSSPVSSSATVRAAGRGCNFAIRILNVNDAMGFKQIETQCTWQSATGTAAYTSTERSHVYLAANVVTGLRLFSILGGNFAATGKIRVYGFAS